MKMAQLAEFGISRWFIERWTQTVGDQLLDWQADAIRHFDLFGRQSSPPVIGPTSRTGETSFHDAPKRNLIVIAPTSSGKTFLAELAMAEALMRRRRVVYVAPLKALTMQKYEHLQAVFMPLGFRVAVSTRDHRGADGALRRGDFDIAVTVYEKWQNLLLTHLDLLTTVDLVVFDEPQLLLDPKRGPTVAHIFDTLAAVERAPRVLLLAARLPHAETLAVYLNASIQRVYRRPVELRLGVLSNGRFHFREHNSTMVGDESLPWNDRLPDSEQPAALLQALTERGERVLVFCPSKAECHRRAQMLAERREASLELPDDDRWRLHSGPSLAPALGDWLSRRIGVHHADLTPHQRALVESLFTAGRLSAVFCTGTLAWGVNLPATTVFIDAQKYTSGPHTGRLVPIPLDRLEFEGMAGRAGRLGSGSADRTDSSFGESETSLLQSSTHDPFGRGILWGRTPCEADLLWQVYIAPETNRGNHATHEAPPAFAPLQRLLHWVVSGLAHSPKEAQRLAERSPFGKAAAHDGGAAGALPSHGKLNVWDDATARLVASGMIQIDGDGRLVSTPRGSKTAAAGLSVRSSAAIVRALAACSDFDPAIWTALLSALPEAADVRLWRSPRNGNDIAAAWRVHFGEGLTESVARRFADDPAAVTAHFPNAAAQTRAMLTALVLDAWAAGTPTQEIEQRFGLPVGRLEPVADTMSWLFETTAALAETVVSARRFVTVCRRAAFEIGHGIRADAAAMVEALGGLVPRQTLLDLIARGWDDPEILCCRRRADLVGLAPPGIIAEMLRRCRRYVQRKSKNKSGFENRPGADSVTTNDIRTTSCHPGTGDSTAHKDIVTTKEDVMSPILHLSGTPCRARLSIELAGRPLTLRLKSFKYLLALAAARRLTRDGWIAKADIETGENQTKYLYQLRRELAQAGAAGVANLIENDGNGHYRLTLPPQAIRFDLDRLLEHPDWDIRSRAERLVQVAAGSSAA